MKTLKNYVQLIGNLGQDVELREFDSGTKKVNFTLATHDYYTDKNGEKIENTEWHNIIAWGKIANWMNESLSKGDEIILLGQLTYRKYESKSGDTKYMTEIKADKFIKISKN